MRRLINTTAKSLIILFVSVLLLVCSVGLLSAHTRDSNQQKASCNASCHSHSQATGISSNELKDEDDKEPIPPTFAWPQIPVNLSLLYVMPVVGVLWFVSNKQKILLTTQLRF